MIKKLIYENVNLKTGFSYSVYLCEGVVQKSYRVYECNQNGDMKCIKESVSCDEVMAFTRRKVSH